MNSNSDWLRQSNAAFLEGYSPALAAHWRRENNLEPAGQGSPVHRTPNAAPTAPTPGPNLGIAAGVGQAPHQPEPYLPKFHSQEQYDMTQFDFARLPPQIDRRMAIQTLMTTPHDTIVTYDGRPMMVSEALRQMLNGGDPATVTIPQNTAGRLGPNDPGRQPNVTAGYPPAGPRIQISQAATDALSQAQYEEFQRTGGIEGLTGPIEGTRVHVRNSSGTVQSRFSFNPETGAVEAGRGINMEMFHDPAAGTK
jgi:hypothetical protein